MRISRVNVVRTIAAAGFMLVAIVYYISNEVGWTSNPTFTWDEGTHSFTCYMNKSGPGEIKITFSNSGRTALIEVGNEKALVEFNGGGITGDIYHGGGVKLKLDPEAYVDGMKTGVGGPCQND